MESDKAPTEKKLDSEVNKQHVDQIRKVFPNYGQELHKNDSYVSERSRKGRNLNRWIRFSVSTLVVLACLGFIAFAVTDFVRYEDREESGPYLMIIAAVVLAIAIPFFIIALKSWRRIHSTSKISMSQTLDTSEKTMTIIETIDDNALYFTPTRVIVARIPGLNEHTFVSSGYEPINLNDFSGVIIWLVVRLFRVVVGRPETDEVLDEYRYLPPAQILAQDSHNYALPYSCVTDVQIFPKYSNHKIRIITESGIRAPMNKNVHQGSTYEFNLYKSIHWVKYQDDLKPILPDHITLNVQPW